MAKIYRANTSAVVPLKEGKGHAKTGVEFGKLYSGNNPVVKQFPALFTELDDDLAPVVEQATAAPGEKRSTRKARKAEPEPEAEVDEDTEQLESSDVE